MAKLHGVFSQHNKEEGTVELYPNKIVPQPKTFKRLVASLKNFESLKKSGNSRLELNKLEK